MNNPPIIGPQINPAPGNAVTTVCEPGDTCSGYHGEFNDEYRTLNGLSMGDLLDKLTAAGHDQVAGLRAHVGQAPDVNVGRLMTALDAVWFRNFEPRSTAGPSMVAAEADEFLKFDVDQRAMISAYMIANARKPSAAAAAAPAPSDSGGTGGVIGVSSFFGG